MSNMKTSPNNSNQIDEVSSHSTSYSNYSNHEQTQTTSGIASMLSPRNIMKFFIKNADESGIHQGSGSPSQNLHKQQKYFSMFKAQQIHKQFQLYTKAISIQMQKFKNHQIKLKNRQSASVKQKQRQQIEEEVKLSKIPQQYFQEWEQDASFEEESILKSEGCIEQKIEKVRHTHKSLKLQALLRIGEQKQRKKSKQKRKPLQEKQSELEIYLDDIELIIYNKTRKYPDRYLHYLVCLNDSDIEVIDLICKVKDIRRSINASNAELNNRHKKIRTLEIKRKKLAQLVDLMTAMKEIYELKKQSEDFKLLRSNQKIVPTNSAVNNDKTQRKSSRQVMKMIAQHPRLGSFYLLQSVTSTLQNVQQLGKTIRTQRFSYECDLLSKALTKSLGSVYSRDSWLRSQLPKESVMIHKMKPQIQMLIAEDANEQGNMNNSYMNISILDQSYCVGANSGSSKKEAQFSKVQINDTKEIVKEWQSYCKQYEIRGRKMQEQDQQICQIFQRAVLKFCHGFFRDLEDYVSYIYAQKFTKNPKIIQTFKERIWYIQPKLFKKIGNVYFQALSTIFKFAITFSNLPNVCQKMFETLQQKISSFMELKGLTQYTLVLHNAIDYQDVSDIISLFDYWFEFVETVSDSVQFIEELQLDVSMDEMVRQFQQNLIKMKNRITEQYLNNLHKFALTADLKNVIEQDDFSSISIPVSSFWILDFIINWGQFDRNCQVGLNIGRNQQVEESFCYGSSILTENCHQTKKPVSFSIFRCIDKKLIIQGKQYRICNSLLLLSAYIQVYLRAKTEWTDMLTSIDQRLCELIGFYIWYCKKMVMSANQSHHNQQQSSKGSSHQKPLSNYSKKNVSSLSMLANNCDLLTKFIDILEINSKPKKVEKALSDLKAIKQQATKQLSMVPFLEVEKQISCLYESRLKTRKQIPTKESVKIIDLLQHDRIELSKFFNDSVIKKTLQNSVKVICKNYFGYLYNMEVRGKSELRWFIPRMKQIIGDLFVDEISNMEKQLKY